MNDYCGRFYFAKDMNGDLIFTIADVGLMIKFVCLLPAKAVVGLIATSPDLARFFEIDCSTGESWGGAIFSLCVVTVVFLGILEEVTLWR
jgi:hypothetical protein